MRRRKKAEMMTILSALLVADDVNSEQIMYSHDLSIADQTILAATRNRLDKLIRKYQRKLNITPDEPSPVDFVRSRTDIELRLICVDNLEQEHIVDAAEQELKRRAS